MRSTPAASVRRWIPLFAVSLHLILSATGCQTEPRGGESEEPSMEFPALDGESASRFARLALNGITREYPNKLDHVMNGPEDVQSPSALHPVFFGSYDWHSCVHGHWLLVRLLKTFPDLPEASEIRATLDGLITPEGVEAEVRDGAGRDGQPRRLAGTGTDARVRRVHGGARGHIACGVA